MEKCTNTFDYDPTDQTAEPLQNTSSYSLSLFLSLSLLYIYIERERERGRECVLQYL
jgi:hypothetical protein